MWSEKILMQSRGAKHWNEFSLAPVEKRGSSLPRRLMVAWPGGEPLWNVPKDLVIFSLLRGRPNTVLNRRLPETTARAVLFIAPFEDCSTRDVSTNLTRVET